MQACRTIPRFQLCVVSAAPQQSSPKTLNTLDDAAVLHHFTAHVGGGDPAKTCRETGTASIYIRISSISW